MMLNQIGAKSTWCWIRSEQRVHDSESDRSNEYMILNQVGANSTRCRIRSEQRVMMLIEVGAKGIWCWIRSEQRMHDAESGRSKEYMKLNQVGAKIFSSIWSSISFEVVIWQDYGNISFNMNISDQNKLKSG